VSAFTKRADQGPNIVSVRLFAPVVDRAQHDVENVAHAMALKDQKPENTQQLIEDESQRLLDRKKR
jgi:hypothetical protein